MKTIYFVHDCQENPAIRRNYLETAGFTVRSFTSGLELQPALERAAPDLLLLDVLLEGKNGFDVCRDVHLKFRARAYPIVLCTHIYRARHFRDEAIRLGASEYLLLPMGFEDFLGRITSTMASIKPLEPTSGRPAA